ncbi:hypothetical protein CHARACLAT_026786 [Characodon lateralis]|uniref:Uncharacterized protein n=1 Tax=Characodon lateralis TaxID=208331 RepID=A0ABU7DAC9_9TELE|nr:hypothetical protein [Characodon lateralis]
MGKVRLPTRVAIFLYNQMTSTQDERTGEGRTPGRTDPHRILLLMSSWFDVFLGTLLKIHTNNNVNKLAGALAASLHRSRSSTSITTDDSDATRRPSAVQKTHGAE